MNALDCPALPVILEKIEPFLILAACVAAIAMAIVSCVRTLRRLTPPKPVGGKLTLSGVKLLTQLPLWAGVFVLLHIGGIGLEYRFGPCNLISRLANCSFIVIPAGVVVAQLLVDRHINDRFHQRGHDDRRFVALHILSWLLLSPLGFTLLGVLEYLVRTPI